MPRDSISIGEARCWQKACDALVAAVTPDEYLEVISDYLPDEEVIRLMVTYQDKSPGRELSEAATEAKKKLQKLRTDSKRGAEKPALTTNAGMVLQNGPKILLSAARLPVAIARKLTKASAQTPAAKLVQSVVEELVKVELSAPAERDVERYDGLTAEIHVEEGVRTVGSLQYREIVEEDG